ncbi:hypothetical protein AGMMS49953_05560 [Endomicrobiia bacterium]|nr:hypothetical protein AGMMS49953_05560 [Endomicrobiia bacterium]
MRIAVKLKKIIAGLIVAVSLTGYTFLSGKNWTSTPLIIIGKNERRRNAIREAEHRLEKYVEEKAALGKGYVMQLSLKDKIEKAFDGKSRKSCDSALQEFINMCEIKKRLDENENKGFKLDIEVKNTI